MRTILTASKDASIYNMYPNNNAGHDEILEIGKTTSIGDFSLARPGAIGDYLPVRGLIHFDLSNVTIPSQSVAYLKLFFATASNLDNEQILYAYPLSMSWSEGTGYFEQRPRNVSDGATWNSSSKTVAWTTAGGDFVTSSFGTATLQSQPLRDVVMDVTNIVQEISGSLITNYGFLLKLDDTTENDTTNKSNCRFFGVQTHTIFEPLLEIAYDSQVFNTGSLRAIPSSMVEIASGTVRQEYVVGDTVVVDLVVRDKYPPKTFDTSARYKNKYYLPRTSYFEVTDVASGVVEIPADQYSAISCNGSTSTFSLATDRLHANRHYDIKIKVVSGIETFYKTIARIRMT